MAAQRREAEYTLAQIRALAARFGLPERFVATRLVTPLDAMPAISRRDFRFGRSYGPATNHP